MERRSTVVGMDLQQQLVIWKRCGYLLDSITLSPLLCHHLVEEDILTGHMMLEIQLCQYNTERTLKMLTLLGTQGNDVFNKFLVALESSHHRKVANELRKTEKSTKFGEMLPPAFTYFLDISEFLRKYPHIAIKLGEEEKHILQTFIEGKIDVEARKTRDSVEEYQEEIKGLKDLIKSMETEMEDRRKQMESSEAKSKLAEDKVQGLEDKISELEDTVIILKRQNRRLTYFKKQQSDLEQYLQEDCKDFLPVTSNSDSNPGVMEADDTGSVNGKSDSNDILKLKLIHSQVNLCTIQSNLLRVSLLHMETEEKRVLQLLKMCPEDSRDPTSKGIKGELADFHKELKQLKKQLESDVKECERKLENKENELRKEEEGSYGESRIETYTDLCTKLKQVISNMKSTHRDELNAQDRKHQQDISDLNLQIRHMNEKHKMEEDRLKQRIRQKMMDLHRREMLFKRLKHQIVTIVNYFSKNMNAQTSIEQCRKIVRSIIGEARKLKAIAEERDPEKREEQEEENGMEEKLPKKKKKRKKRRKIADALSDERLLVLAGKVSLEWRALGSVLGLTNNRMDLIEVDPTHPGYSNSYKMLLTWRDEDKGKLVQLIGALQDISQEDLAMSIMPPDMLRWALQEEPPGGTTVTKQNDSPQTLIDDIMIKGSVPDLSSIPKLPQIGA